MPGWDGSISPARGLRLFPGRHRQETSEVASQPLCHNNGELDKHISVKVIQRSNVDSRLFGGLYFATGLLSRNLFGKYWRIGSSPNNLIFDGYKVCISAF